SIEAAERRAEVADPLAHPCRLGDADRFIRHGRQCRAGEFFAQAALGHVSLEDPSLVRLRRGIEAVQVNDHAAAAFCRRPSSLAWMPPKPPFDMTSTWSPARASETIAETSASSSSAQRTRAPSAA